MGGESEPTDSGRESGRARWRPSDGFAPGAWKYALLAVALAIPAAFLSRSKRWTRRWGVAAPLLSVGALLFHRDPDRNSPESGVVAPADGRVSVVREEAVEAGDGVAEDGAGDAETEDDADVRDAGDSDAGDSDAGASEDDGSADDTEETRVRIGVFMNVTDVHVNRAPLGGRVEAVEHEPGLHRPAFSKESDRNEKFHIRFPDHEVTLIAGAFARRIHPYVEPGDDLARGERLGHISFGSRADVLLPESFDLADVAVERGEKVRAGETVLAER